MPLKLWKNAHGVWQVRGTVAGQRIRKSTGTRDEATARKYAARLEREAWQRHLDPVPEGLTFEAAALLYLEADREARFLAPLIRHFRGWDVAEIRQGHIHDAATKLYPLASAATRNRQVITPAQAVINFAHERGHCPPIKVRRFKEDPVPRQAVDRGGWLDLFVAKADELDLEDAGTIALLMFSTGARITEALSIEELRGRVAIMPTKTGYREAILPREVLLRMGGRTRFRWATRWSVYKPWRAICEAAGIPYIPPHQAGRHSFATEMMVRRRIDAATTATLGGWSSTRLLVERYAHPEDLPNVVDEVFGEGAEMAGIGKVRRK